MSELDVIGIGNAIVDIIARCDDAVLTELNLPKGHMQLISAEEADRLYDGMGPAVEVSGGSAANSCAGISALGGKAAFTGVVNNDQFGKIFKHDLNAFGVKFDTAFAGGETPTARCLVFVTPDGERTMNTFLGACAELSPEHLDEALIKSAKVTYLEGYLFDRPEAKEAFFKAAEIAKGAGHRVALSLSDAFCVERHRDDFMKFIRGHVDVLFANADEIKSLYQVASFDEAAEASRHDVELAALTQGIEGSFIIHGNATMAVPSYKVDNVVDTTGAGDLYAAGFLYGFTNFKNLDTCGSLGSIAAAEVISHFGARPEGDLREIAKANQLL